LQMKSTVFNPKTEKVAATEKVEGIRLKGVVHDENARALGGVSTNAGLFSNLEDLEAFVQMMLNFGKLKENKVLTRYSVMQMLKVQTGTLMPRRTVGWLSGKYFSGAPDFASEKSIGHSGFTGTSIFMDFERKVGIIILTNRVYYGRANRKHIRLRRLISNAVYGELLG
jgi:CubicO group peptidase (beta-lactamase class C family)